MNEEPKINGEHDSDEESESEEDEGGVSKIDVMLYTTYAPASPPAPAATPEPPTIELNPGTGYRFSGE